MIEGTLDRLHLGDLLQWLQMGRLSGRLTLIDGSSRRHLDFLDGCVVFASSTVPSERLASWLASEGVLEVGVLRRLLAVSLLRRTLFTDLLLERGSCPADELLGSLVRLAETVTSRVLTAPAVRFVLDPGYPVRQLLGLSLLLEPNLLMMQAARRSDESPGATSPGQELSLPVGGEALDAFFRDLVREGITDEERVDGEEIARLLELLHQIAGALAAWTSSGPGLLPVPREQASRLAGVAQPSRAHLMGAPHMVWNQMVLACSLHSPTDPHPTSMDELYTRCQELDVWDDLTRDRHWQRPELGEIDQIAAAAACEWSRSASAAAPHLGVDADLARLAVHLLVIPTDLVLWVLANVPLPHRSLRAVLLRRLPPRLGFRLAQLTDLPEPLRGLFGHTVTTRLGVCLDLGRRVTRVGRVWPRTVPEDEGQLLGLVAPEVLQRAEAAARTALTPVEVASPARS